jgi:AcrR family transcriptional regulator
MRKFGMRSTQRIRKAAENTTGPHGESAEAILKTAGELFAQHGFAAVSMRMIAAKSKQQLSSANYYFGSKAGLFENVFLRRIVPVNIRRITLLKERLTNGPLKLSGIVDSFIRPLFEINHTESHSFSAKLIMQFSKQLLSNPAEHEYLLEYYDEVSRDYITALTQGGFGLSTQDAIWGYNYLVAVLVFTLAGKSSVAKLPGDLVVSLDPKESDEVIISRLTRFICAGLTALRTSSIPSAAQ